MQEKAEELINKVDKITYEEWFSSFHCRKLENYFLQLTKYIIRTKNPYYQKPTVIMYHIMQMEVSFIANQLKITNIKANCIRKIACTIAQLFKNEKLNVWDAQSAVKKIYVNRMRWITDSKIRDPSTEKVKTWIEYITNDEKEREAIFEILHPEEYVREASFDLSWINKNRWIEIGKEKGISMDTCVKLAECLTSLRMIFVDDKTAEDQLARYLKKWSGYQ